MNNNQNPYLSEKKYQKTKKVLITIGCISLCIGLTLFIISFIIKEPAMGQEGWFEAETKINTLRFASFIFSLMIPMPMFFIAFGRNIMTYQTQQMMPVAKEGMKEMAPIYGEIAKEVSKGISEGIKESEE